MIKLILTTLFVLAAIAVSPLLIGEKGYILIAMGDLTIESTVVTATFFLVVLFIILLFTLKVLKGGVKLSTGTWHKFAFANKRRSERDYRKGIAEYLLGNHQQAEKLLASSADKSHSPLTAYLVAAKAAHQQNDNVNAERYLQLADHQGQNVKEHGIESILVQVDILMANKQWQKAREMLDNYHTHIGHDHRLLAHEITLSIAEQRFEHAIDFIAKAKKQKAITSEQISGWQQAAYLGQFEQLVHDKSAQTLEQYWQGLARKLKQDNDIIAAYCQVLAKHQLTEQLNPLLLPVIKKGKNTDLINQLKTIELAAPSEVIKVTQQHLQKDQHNHFWLSCLGHFALSDKQWPLAERAFHSIASSAEPLTPLDAKGYARALSEQGKYQQAAELLISL
ncbi:heme biosynthesis HemY N-terminal domain-containing protein [Thalassotalea euphylliae]|uniref:Heme biosynthesis protein HemY n=1 Tax=Thalassotalea euphylliae TaxID=1655234 RepID=A0A3E0UJJ6_9GAMM|nr:heme biosynthesis HemY N-terminal domain-containing protein [Thalassotalea euphylliae]REL37178.1 heme biosynthesis protein HemY [Thalassotalea euphylliae]